MIQPYQRKLYKQLEDLKDALEKWIDPEDPCVFDTDVKALLWALNELKPFDGNSLRKRREARELAPCKLGSMVGVPVAQVQKWEDGTLAPTARMRERLASTLRCDFGDLGK